MPAFPCCAHPPLQGEAPNKGAAETYIHYTSALMESLREDYQRLYKAAVLPCPPLHWGPFTDPTSKSLTMRQLASNLHKPWQFKATDILPSRHVHGQLRTPWIHSGSVYTTFWRLLGGRVPHMHSRSESTGTQTREIGGMPMSAQSPTRTPSDDEIYVTQTRGCRRYNFSLTHLILQFILIEQKPNSYTS